MPAITSVSAAQTWQLGLVQILCVDTIIGILAQGAPVLGYSKSLVEASSAGNNQPSVRINSLLGDDVDHAIDGVCPPNGSAGTADHFDPFDILKRHIQHVPEDSAEGGHIYRAAVYQHQQFVAELTVKSASADGPGVGVDLSHIHPRHHSQKIGDIRRARTGYILGRDHENCRSGARKRLLAF